MIALSAEREIALFALLMGVAAATTAQPPHIIMIVADDLGYGDPSFTGR